MPDFERFLAFDRGRGERLAARSEPFAHGVARFRDELPAVHDLNALVVPGDTAAEADELAAEADRLQGAAGLLHRKVAVGGSGGRRLAPRFRELGWQAVELVVLVHDGRRLSGEGAEEVRPEELDAFWHAASGARHPDRDELRQLVAARHLRREATSVRYFAARADGRVVSGCDLFSDGRTAQVESVDTLEPYRGRGLARSVVAAAVTAARTGGHDAVFIVADADGWPAGWYERLGFRPVGELWDFLRTPAPLRAIRLRTPRLELRLAADGELAELGRLARRGIHPPERTPFLTPWTDAAEEPGFVESVVAYHRGSLARWSPEDWSLDLIAFVGGRVAGTQGVAARRFAETREVATGSWLGAEFQGRGLGTEMRAAVLELAFRGLGAEMAVSGAFADNPRSARVSEKLGYTEAGTATRTPRGEPVAERIFRLERAAWRSPVPVEIEALEPALPCFGVTSGRSRRSAPAGRAG